MNAWLVGITWFLQAQLMLWLGYWAGRFAEGRRHD